jgi:hypothetical protein
MSGLRRACVIGVLFALPLMIGCTTTRVNFDGPPNTVLSVDGKRYVLPAQVEMSRPGPGSSTRHEVALVATVQNQELRAKGHIDVMGYEETDADKMAINTCHLDEDHLSQIFSGNVLRFTGQSASRQPLYEMMLGKE